MQATMPEIKRNKKWPIEQERIFANCVSNMVLISEIYKEFV
jgi:hypothetical protein